MCSFIISDSRAFEKEPLMINGPPAQDSPKHILSALNDFCIQKILCSLETREDLMCAAESCTRFQKNAISCFRNKFKTLIIEPKGATKSYGHSMEDEVVKRFLSANLVCIEKSHNRHWNSRSDCSILWQNTPCFVYRWLWIEFPQTVTIHSSTQIDVRILSEKFEGSCKTDCVGHSSTQQHYQTTTAAKNIPKIRTFIPPPGWHIDKRSIN